MKIVTLIICMTCVFSGLVKAQIFKDKWMVGSSTNLIGSIHEFGAAGYAPNNNFGFYFGKSKTKVNGVERRSANTILFNFTPSFGKMIKSYTMLGLSTGISYFSNKRDNGISTETTFIALTPFTRFYLGNIGISKPYFEARGGILGVFLNDNSEFDPVVGGKMALSYFMNSKIALDFFVDYTYAWDDSEETGGIFGLGIGFSFFR